MLLLILGEYDQIVQVREGIAIGGAVSGCEVPVVVFRTQHGLHDVLKYGRSSFQSHREDFPLPQTPACSEGSETSVRFSERYLPKTGLQIHRGEVLGMGEPINRLFHRRQGECLVL